MAKSKWPRRIVKILAIAVLVVVLLAVAAKYWIVPAVARQQIDKQLATYWDGSAEIESIDFRFFGPTRATGLTIKDRKGRVWLRVGSAEFVLSGWPGFSPVLTAVKIESVEGTAHFEAGRCNPPLRELPKRSEEPSKHVDLHDIAVNGVHLALASAEEKVALLGKLNLSLRRQGDEYRLSLTAPAPEDANAALTVTGSLPAAEGGAVDLSLRLRRTVTPDELKRLRKILNISRELNGSAELVATITATGNKGQTLTVRPAGRIELTAPELSTDTGELLKDLAISAKVSGDGRKVVVAGNIDRGTCSRGLLAGEFSASMGLTGDLSALKYSGRIGVKDMNLPNLEAAISGKTKMKSGQLRALVSFQGQGTDLNALTYSGDVLLKDADLRGDNPLVVLLTMIFRRLSVDPSRIVGGSTAHVPFQGRGLVVTLREEARLENNISALVIETGGVIRIGQESLDAYFIGAPVKELRNLLANIPIVGALTSLADKLTRLHVYGPWDKPTITKEPAKDIQEGTVGFFRGVVGGGGKLGAMLLKPLNGLLKPQDPNNK